MNFNEKVTQLESLTPIRKSLPSFTDPDETAMEAPSRKSGLSAKPKANVGTKVSGPKHATKSGQVDGQKSSKPGSSEIQNDEDNYVPNRVRRRSTGSSSNVFGGPTTYQKSRGGRAPIDPHRYVDDSRSLFAKATLFKVRPAAAHLSPSNVPSHSFFGFGNSQASTFGNTNASPRGSPVFGPRKSDNISSDSPSAFESSKDEGQNDLFTYRGLFGFPKPVKGQRKCTFRIPGGKKYPLWLSDGYDIYDIVSDGTLYRKGSTLFNREGKRLTELEPNLPDEVRAYEIREDHHKQGFWLDFVHSGSKQHKNILQKRRRKPVEESDEENENQESEAEDDENSKIEGKEEEEKNEDQETEAEDEENEEEEEEEEKEEEGGEYDEEDDDEDDDNNTNTEVASVYDNGTDATSESGECDLRIQEYEEWTIDLAKIDIEQLRSEGLEVDLEKLGRNYRAG